MINRQELKELLDFGLRRIQSSAWTTDDLAREVSNLFDLEKEQATWREQRNESESKFFGQSYL